MMTIDRLYASNLSNNGNAYYPPLFIINPQSSMMCLLFTDKIMQDRPT